MAHPKAQTLSTPARLKSPPSFSSHTPRFSLPLDYEFMRMLLLPWAAFLKYPPYFEKGLLPQTFTQTPLPERTVAAYLLGS